MDKPIKATDRIDLAATTKTPSKTSERRHNTMWMLSFYGTAIGAGTLFLPIEAGVHGLIPLLLMALLSLPMTYFSHRALCRLILSSSHKSSDITDVVKEYFGHRSGTVLTFLYCFAIFPILLMYSVGMTNTIESFIANQTSLNTPPRALLAFILISGLSFIIRFGQESVLRVMGYLVYPFVATLIFLSLYLIPFWNGAILYESSLRIASSPNLFVSMWLIIPVIVFSFNFSPIISSFAVSQKQRYKSNAEIKSSKLLKYSSIMMVLTVMFFVFSCVLSLSQSDLAAAKTQNISILSYLANHLDNPVVTYFGPMIALIAITKSFLGHYLGAKEGLIGLSTAISKSKATTITSPKGIALIELFMLTVCWFTATINPNILKMIETISGPAVTIILFLLPMYAIARVPAMRKYRSFFSDVFISITGLVAVSAIVLWCL